MMSQAPSHPSSILLIFNSDYLPLLQSTIDLCTHVHPDLHEQLVENWLIGELRICHSDLKQVKTELQTKLDSKEQSEREKEETRLFRKRSFECPRDGKGSKHMLWAALLRRATRQRSSRALLTSQSPFSAV